MMIDYEEQGRGYGESALERVIDYIKTKPFGDSNRVALTCNRDNHIARRLYERMDFAFTGVVYGDEDELATTIA